MIIVSTDGACLTESGGAIGWAWVAHGSGRFDAGGAPGGSAQAAELMALRHAVAAHPGDEPLFVESGSQYAIRCASEWLPAWKAQQWRTASGGEVPHLAAVRAIDDVIADRSGPVRFRWVRGHVDSPFTARAHELARAAAADWADGRGDLDGLLLDDTAAGAPGADEAADADGARRGEPVAVGGRARRTEQPEPGRSLPTSGPGWELETLF